MSHARCSDHEHESALNQLMYSAFAFHVNSINRFFNYGSFVTNRITSYFTDIRHRHHHRRHRHYLCFSNSTRPVQALAGISRSALCCHSNETRALTANLPNSAHLEGTPCHSSKLHPGPCSSAEMRRGTDTQTAVTTIYFASSTID